MHGVLHNRFHHGGERIHNTIESALLSAGSLLFAVLTILILFLGVMVIRAT